MRPNALQSIPLLAPAAAFALACAAEPARPPASVERDSAGVIIVESGRPAWGEAGGTAWTLGDRPLLEIGLVDGPAEYQLFRAYSAVRLPDGRLVIANGGTSELRFYDETGGHLFSAGRIGEGPGEFRDLQRVWYPGGDSLLAYDFFPSRFSVFTTAGEFVRSFHVASPDGRQVVVRGRLADGSLIAMGAPIWSRPGATTGVVRDSAPYYRFDAEGTLLATFGPFPSMEAYRVVSGERWFLTSLPFARAPVAATAGDRFHFGPADAYELRTYSPDGALLRITRLPDERRPVTAAHIAEYRRGRLEAAEREGARAEMERRLSEMPYPDALPAYERVEVDAEGNLWVADYRVDRSAGATWKVFSPAGSYLGAVTVPARFDVYQIGPDFVLGRWLDELEVEFIRVYPLHKP